MSWPRRFRLHAIAELRDVPCLPAPRQFPKPRVFANPVEVNSQGLSQFAQRSHHAGRRVEADQLQFAQFGRNFCVRRLINHRQESLRQRERLVDLPAATLGLHRLGRDHEHHSIRLLDEPAEPYFPGLARFNVMAVKNWRQFRRRSGNSTGAGGKARVRQAGNRTCSALLLDHELLTHDRPAVRSR